MTISGPLELDRQVATSDLVRGDGQLVENVQHAVEVDHELPDLVVARRTRVMPRKVPVTPHQPAGGDGCSDRHEKL